LQNRNNRKPRSNKEPAAGLYVEVRNGDITGALRRFKKIVQESGVLQDYKDRQEYIKPSEKRKRAKASAVRRHQRTMQKRMEELGY
jgi:small subunit ribosomal protein S21|tara:strand:+ start:731 stop:988 length:258 start_codon:yes stop_codon:yes gene_type:complete